MTRFVLATSGGVLLGLAVAVLPAAASNMILCQNDPDDPLCRMYPQLGAEADGASSELDPFLCRFGKADAGAPVLLSATRADCTSAGGVVMTPTQSDEAASE
jgi:hypothetical protein